jgi:hypothetical protein
MRWPARLRRTDDAVDEELLGIFRHAREELAPSALDIARARNRTAHRMAEIQGTPGGFRRKLALAAAGGAGLWTALIGTAAANKAAAAAVGVTLLVGSGAAIEASGIGPAVRDSLGVGPAVEHGVGPAEDSPAAASVEKSDGAPGNLVTVMRDDGTFLVRGVVTEVGDGSLKVNAADASEVEFGLAADVSVHQGGPGDKANGQAVTVAATLVGLAAGDLVLLKGQCSDGAQNLHDPTCLVTSVTLLGPGGEQLTDLPLGAPDGVSGVGVGDAPPQGQPSDTPPVDVPEGAQP